MRSILSMIVVLLFTTLAVSQEDKKDANTVPTQYTVSVSEIRVNLAADLPISLEDIAENYAQYQKKEQVTLMETVTFSVVEGRKFSVLYGRTVPVVYAVSGNVKKMRDQPLGFTVAAMVKRIENQLNIELSYQASRILEPTDDDVPPEIDRVELKTDTLIMPGKTKAIMAKADTESSFLIVSVHNSKQDDTEPRIAPKSR